MIEERQPVQIVTSHTTWLDKGNALYIQKRFHEAIEHYDKAISGLDNYSKAHNNKGLALYALQRYDEAIYFYRKAIKLDKKFAEAYNNLGVAQNALGKFNDAIESFNHAISLDKDYYKAFNNKGIAENALKRPNDAIESFNKAISIKKDYACVYNNKGIALKILGQYEEAIECYNIAISIQPNYSNCYNNKGYAYERLQKFDDALLCYELALRHCSTHAKAKDNKKNLEKLLEKNKKNTEKMNLLANNTYQRSDSNITYDVFISYSWKQKEIADNLYSILTEGGLRCWIDRNELLAGESLYEELMEAIICSQLVLLCISNSYLQSANCYREFFYAQKNKHPDYIVPIKFGDNNDFVIWPPDHKIFFILTDPIYIDNIYNYLLQSPKTTPVSEELQSFILQLHKKLE